MDSTPLINAAPKPKNWIGRNWPWAVPLGCLTLLAAGGACVGIIMSFVFSMMKSSDAYQGAVARAKASPAVVAELGQPIAEGFFTSGSINTSGPSGQADLAIPISGPKGKATIYLSASKSAGQWTYSTLAVEIQKTRQRIDLLHEPQ